MKTGFAIYLDCMAGIFYKLNKLNVYLQDFEKYMLYTNFDMVKIVTP